MINHAVINSLQNDKISDWSKLKKIADNKINVTKNWNSFWEG